MSLSIEPGRSTTNLCGCCGKTSHTHRGFVSQEGQAFAVYFAGFTEDHGAPMLTLVVSLGDWSPKGTPADREAAVIKVRNVGGEIEMMVQGPLDQPWNDIGVLGRLLSREEMLAGPRKGEFFHIADHVIAEDQRVVPYLRGKPQGVKPKRTPASKNKKPRR